MARNTPLRRRQRLAAEIAAAMAPCPDLLSARAVESARRPFVALVCSVVTLGLCIGDTVASSAAAATYTVTSAADSGTGTLRNVVAAANYNAGSTIQFAAGLQGTTITLTSGPLAISAAMVIQGPGSGLLTISGNHASSIFNAASTTAVSPSLAISGLALTAGNAGTGNGGVIKASGVTLNLQDVLISGSSAQYRGGIYAGPSFSQPSLTLNRVVLQNNTATAAGGGLCANGLNNVTISNSRIAGNYSTLSAGGAQFFTDALVTVSGSVISGNVAHNGNGGGVLANYSPLQIAYSTVSGNAAYGALGPTSRLGNGGGLWALDSNVTLQGARFLSNSADNFGGGAYLRDGRSTPQATANVQRSAISGNTVGVRGGGLDALALQQATLGYSLVSANRCTGLYNGSGGGGGLSLRSTVASNQLFQSTIYGNYAFGGGGGIDILGGNSGAGTSITGVTIVGNSASTGYVASNGIRVATGIGSPTLDSSIVANNTNTSVASGNADLQGSFVVNFSLIKTPGTASESGSNNLPSGTDPALGPLAVNGGPTQSLLPNLGSPVLSVGDSAIAQTQDQRGLPRKIGSKVDMGAVERQTPEDIIFRNGFDPP